MVVSKRERDYYKIKHIIDGIRQSNYLCGPHINWSLFKELVLPWLGSTDVRSRLVQLFASLHEMLNSIFCSQRLEETLVPHALFQPDSSHVARNNR